MKKGLRIKNILVTGGVILFAGLLVFLFSEAFFNCNFRTTQDRMWVTQGVDLRGLEETKASGGTAVRFWDLQRRLSHVREHIIIVDGISEYHGYVNGIPTSYFAYQHPNPHWKYYIRRLVFTGTTDVRPDLVTSEAAEAKKQGFFYKNVRIGSKFLTSTEAIDDFVNLFDKRAKDCWFHFHCHYGKGRTSLMMVMHDIMKNAPQVSLEDIVERQHRLGAEDLLNRKVHEKGSYTKEQLKQRREFIRDFYQFICQRKGGGVQTWSEWSSLKNRPLNPKASSTLLP